jgi:hypothetical protein
LLGLKKKGTDDRKGSFFLALTARASHPPVERRRPTLSLLLPTTAISSSNERKHRTYKPNDSIGAFSSGSIAEPLAPTGTSTGMRQLQQNKGGTQGITNIPNGSGGPNGGLEALRDEVVVVTSQLMTLQALVTTGLALVNDRITDDVGQRNGALEELKALVTTGLASANDRITADVNQLNASREELKGEVATGLALVDERISDDVGRLDVTLDELQALLFPWVVHQGWTDVFLADHSSAAAVDEIETIH